MKIMCSWCVSEGKIAYLGVRGSESDPRISHAICEGHLVQLRSESMTARRSPESSGLYSLGYYKQDSIALDVTAV